ncbi:uncharacterized protein LOC135830487 isoform X2 [Sycon ciliatum]|uniref:uncharacterized protein LOC135830487 isoform X2 n=1 Tax=Sycon ciliatum TaxID=27933 RepID=UPI0031F5FDF9
MKLHFAEMEKVRSCSVDSTHDTMLDALDHIMTIHRQKIQELEDQLEKERNEYVEKLQSELANFRHHMRLKDETIACLRKQLSQSLNRPAMLNSPSTGARQSWTLEPLLSRWKHTYDYARSYSPTPQDKLRRSISCDNNVLCPLPNFGPPDVFSQLQSPSPSTSVAMGMSSVSKAATARQQAAVLAPFMDMTAKSSSASIAVHPRLALAVSHSNDTTTDPADSAAGFDSLDSAPGKTVTGGEKTSPDPDYAILLRQTSLTSTMSMVTAKPDYNSSLARLDSTASEPISHISSMQHNGNMSAALPSSSFAVTSCADHISPPVSVLPSADDSTAESVLRTPLPQSGGSIADPQAQCDNGNVPVQTLLQTIWRNGKKGNGGPTEELVASSRALSAGASNLHSVLMRSAMPPKVLSVEASHAPLSKTSSTTRSNTVPPPQSNQAVSSAHYYSTICSVASLNSERDSDDKLDDPFLGSSSDLRRRLNSEYVPVFSGEGHELGVVEKSRQRPSQESLLVCVSHSPLVSGSSAAVRLSDVPEDSRNTTGELSTADTRTQIAVAPVGTDIAETDMLEDGVSRERMLAAESSGDMPYCSADEGDAAYPAGRMMDVLYTQGNALAPSPPPPYKVRKWKLPGLSPAANLPADGGSRNGNLSPLDIPSPRPVLLHEVPETQFNPDDTEASESFGLICATRKKLTPSGGDCNAQFVIPETLNIDMDCDAPQSQRLERLSSADTSGSPLLANVTTSTQSCPSHSTKSHDRTSHPSGPVCASNHPCAAPCDSSTASPVLGVRRTRPLGRTSTTSEYVDEDEGEISKDSHLVGNPLSIDISVGRLDGNCAASTSNNSTVSAKSSEQPARSRLQRPAASKVTGRVKYQVSVFQSQATGGSAAVSTSSGPAEAHNDIGPALMSRGDSSACSSPAVSVGGGEGDCRCCQPLERDDAISHGSSGTSISSSGAADPNRLTTSYGSKERLIQGSLEEEDEGEDGEVAEEEKWSFVPIPPTDSQLSLDLSAPFPQSPELKARNTPQARPKLKQHTPKIRHTRASSDDMRSPMPALPLRAASFAGRSHVPVVPWKAADASATQREHPHSQPTSKADLDSSRSDGDVSFDSIAASSARNAANGDEWSANNSDTSFNSTPKPGKDTDSNWLKRGIDVTKRTTDRWLSRSAVTTPTARKNRKANGLVNAVKARGLHPGINVVATGSVPSEATATKQITLLDQHYFQSKKATQHQGDTHSKSPQHRSPVDAASKRQGRLGTVKSPETFPSADGDGSLGVVSSTPIPPGPLSKAKKSSRRMTWDSTLTRSRNAPAADRVTAEGAELVSEEAPVVQSPSPRKADRRPPLVKRTAVINLEPVSSPQVAAAPVFDSARAADRHGEVACGTVHQSTTQGDSTWFELSHPQQQVEISTAAEDRCTSPPAPGRRSDPTITVEQTTCHADSQNNSYNLLAGDDNNAVDPGTEHSPEVTILDTRPAPMKENNGAATSGNPYRPRFGSLGAKTAAACKEVLGSKSSNRPRGDSPHQKTAVAATAGVFEVPDPDLTQDFIKPMPARAPLGQERPYKFQASVRKHHLREQLPATKESCCSKYYELDDDGDHHCQHVSRHRELNAPTTDTPDDFWDVSFPSSEICKEKGYMRDDDSAPQPLRKRKKVRNSRTKDMS